MAFMRSPVRSRSGPPPYSLHSLGGGPSRASGSSSERFAFASQCDPGLVHQPALRFQAKVVHRSSRNIARAEVDLPLHNLSYGWQANLRVYQPVRARSGCFYGRRRGALRSSFDAKRWLPRQRNDEAVRGERDDDREDGE